MILSHCLGLKRKGKISAITCEGLGIWTNNKQLRLNRMKIVMIGAGYVGLVTGACFAEFGFHVTCVDKDKDKIEGLNQGVIPIFEPGLESLVRQCVHAKKLSFSTNLSASVSDADVVMIAVGTPSRQDDGHADLSYVFKAVDELALHLTPYTMIVTKSTVPVGTGDMIVEAIKTARPDLVEGVDFDVASNPEFLREGSAILDFMRPDRVIVGSDSEKARVLLQRLYHPLYLIETPILFTSRRTAEMIKYAANGFLALKIAFINQISDVCEKVGADVQELAKGIGLDKRIGPKFLNVSPGYGGSCFPKDTKALSMIAHEFGAPCTIIDAVIEANNERKIRMAQRVIDILDARGLGKKHKKKPRIAILGLTFKPNTDDMRDAASLVIIPELLKEEMNVVIYDPLYCKGSDRLDHLKTHGVEWVDQVTFASGTNDAVEGADGMIFLTEWNEFRGIDLNDIRPLLAPCRGCAPLLIDYRNIFKPNEVQGYHYVSLGRKDVLDLKA